MATERVEMHVLREILRQKLGLRRSHRQVATSLGVSAGKVAGVFADARALGLERSHLYRKMKALGISVRESSTER